MKSVIHFLSVCVLVWCMAALVEADPIKSGLPFDQQMKNVSLLQQTADYKSLQTLGQELLTVPSTYSVDQRRQLIVEVCSALASTDFGNQNGRPLADALARRVIKTDPTMDYWSKVKLTWCFDYSESNKDSLDDWVKARTQRASFIVGIWSQLSKDLEGFDPEKRDFVYQVPFPAGVHLPTGVSPDAISDPVLRKQYARQVEENRKKADLYFEKTNKAKALDWLLSNAEDGLVALYTQPPYNEKEVKMLLSSIPNDNQAKQRVLTSVENAMRSTITGVNRSAIASPDKNTRR